MISKRGESPKECPRGGKWLPLSKDRFALIDEEDFERVSPWLWSVCVRQNPYSPYALRRQMHKTIYLHRFIMNAPKNRDVDHIDGNGLNCRKSNLRVCTHAQNQYNYTKCAKRTTSKFKGVHIDRDDGRWISRIKFKGKSINIGVFDTQEQAAHEYDKAAVSYFGKYAKLNFPMVGLSYTRQLFRLGLAWSR